MYLYVAYAVAWLAIGSGALWAARCVLSLTNGRAGPQMKDPRARSEVRSDLRQSLTSVACGLSVFGTLESRADPLWGLASLPLLALMGWNFVPWLRVRMSGKSASETGEGASEPDTSAGGEQRYRRELPWPVEGASAEEIAEWVDRKIFSTTRLRPGYDEEEVDVFIDAIRDTLLGVAETRLTSNEVRNVQFTQTRLRPGYDEGDVDTFLKYVGMRLAT